MFKPLSAPPRGVSRVCGPNSGLDAPVPRRPSAPGAAAFRLHRSPSRSDRPIARDSPEHSPSADPEPGALNS